MNTNCDHVCHTRGLNPWVKSCPACGCANPKYDPQAVSDIPARSDDFDPFAVFGVLAAKVKADRERKG